MDKTLIDAAKLKFPGAPLRVLKAPGFDTEILARVPDEPEWAAFRGMQDDPSQANLAPKTLVLRHAIEPAVSELFSKFPGLAESYAKALIAETGAGIKVSVEKV